MMNEKLTNYVNGVFAPYDEAKSVAELKADLLSDLQERFRELKAEGKDDETAFDMTIESIGDIEQTVQEVANLSRSLERQGLDSWDRRKGGGAVAHCLARAPRGLCMWIQMACWRLDL